MAATHAIFEVEKMMSEHIDTYLKHGSAHAALDNGNIVTAGTLVSGEKDLYTTAAPTDVTADTMYIVDAVKIDQFEGYRIDFSKDPRYFYTNSGEPARLRKLAVGDTCKISAAGFASAPTAGAYAVPANGVLTLAPAANLSGSTKIAFKVLEKVTIYVGSESVDGYRLECVVA